jgi:RNA polymerase sigma factor (sigma-70 family)
LNNITILNQCLKGKKKAQYKLYEYCYEKFFPTCRRYTLDDERARETLNLGFLKVLNNLKKYDQDKSFDAWVNRIMITTSIDEYRKEVRHKSSEINYETEIHYNSNNIEEEIAKNDVLYYLEFLPPTGKQVFNLFGIDGYSHKEIAKMLGFSEDTSKWHVKESRRKLKEMLSVPHNIKS